MRLHLIPKIFFSGVITSLLVCFPFNQSSVAAYSHVSTTAATPASLVKDIDPLSGTDGNAAPNQYVAVGNTTFFVAEDHTNARELWKTDGTQSGTTLVRDIIPGGYNQSGPYDLTAFNNALFFATSVEYGPTILWRSDGTAKGTIPVLTLPNDIEHIYYMTVLNGELLFIAKSRTYAVPVLDYMYRSDGTTSGTILIKQVAVDTNTITAVGNQLYFVANNSATGSELWKSDGTIDGTTIVKDIRPGSGDAFGNAFTTYTRSFSVVGTKLFFVANDGTTGDELWQSDGTTDGTTLVKDITPPGLTNSLPTQLTAVGTNLFFVEYGGLWKTDGTNAGTVQIRQSDGNAVISAVDLIAVGNQVYFWQILYNIGLYSTSLWKSDGTNAGTVQIKSFALNDPNNPSPAISVSYSQGIINNKLLFISRNNIWVSDGSEAGTYLMKEMPPFDGVTDPSPFLKFQGVVLFRGSNENGISGLWKSDGTEAGTVPLTIGSSGEKINYPKALTIIGTHFFFSLGQPYISDGTPAGTFQLGHIDADGDSSFHQWQTLRAPDTVSFKGMLFFPAGSADGSADGLWKSDGTEAGTSLVKAFKADFGENPLPFNLTVVNDTLFFATSTSGAWYLWKSDGSEQGTVIVKQYDADDYHTVINNFTNVNGTLFFTALAPLVGRELWKSDGTTDGTVVVKDITPGSDDSHLEGLTPVGKTLFFFNQYGSNKGLWKSDGTEAGTVQLKSNGESGSIYYPFYVPVSIGDTLFFGFSDSAHGFELWKSDGTDAGTVLVKDINPGSTGSYPFGLSVLNGMLYFVADDGTHGNELWKSDGTENGTVLVRDINSQANVGAISSNIHVIGDTMVFLADDGTHGTELWKSDGTETGTVLLKDLVPGTQQWDLPFFEAKPLPDGKRALLDVYTSDSGIELWVSDGTQQGTLQVQDIAPGPASADPSNITIVGDRAFFVADDMVHGRELWSLRLTDIPTPNAPAPDMPTPDAPTPYVPSNQRSVFLPSVLK